MQWPLSVRGAAGAALSVLEVGEAFADFRLTLRPKNCCQSTPRVYLAAFHLRPFVDTDDASEVPSHSKRPAEVTKTLRFESPIQRFAAESVRLDGLVPNRGYHLHVQLTAQDGDARQSGRPDVRVSFSTLPCVVPHRLCHVGQDFVKVNFVRPLPSTRQLESSGRHVDAPTGDCGAVEVEIRVVEAATRKLGHPCDPPPAVRRTFLRAVRFAPPEIVPWLPEDCGALKIDQLPHSTALALRVRSVRPRGEGEAFGPFSDETFVETLIPERLTLVDVADDNQVVLQLAQRQTVGSALRLAERAPVLQKYKNSSDGIQERRVTITAAWDRNETIRDALIRRRDEISNSLDVLRVAVGGDAINDAAESSQRAESARQGPSATVMDPAQLRETEASASAARRRRAEVSFIVAAYERRVESLSTVLDRPYYRRLELAVDLHDATTATNLPPARYDVQYDVRDENGWRGLTQLESTVCGRDGDEDATRIPEIGAVAEDATGENDVGFMRALLGTNASRAGVVTSLTRDAFGVSLSAVDHVEAASLMRVASGGPQGEPDAARALEVLEGFAQARSAAEGMVARGIDCEFIVCLVEHPRGDNRTAADAMLSATIPPEGISLVQAKLGEAVSSPDAAPKVSVSGIRRITDVVRSLGRVMRLFVKGDATSGLATALPTRPSPDGPNQFEVPLLVAESSEVTGRAQLFRATGTKHALSVSGLTPGATYTAIVSHYCALSRAWHPFSRPLTVTTHDSPKVEVCGFPPPDGTLFGTLIKVGPPPQVIAELRRCAALRGVAAVDNDFTIADTPDLTLPDSALCFATSKAVEFVVTPGVHSQPMADFLAGGGGGKSQASFGSKRSVASRRTLASRMSTARQSTMGSSAAFSSAEALQAEVLRFPLADALRGVVLPHFNNPGAVSIHAQFVDDVAPDETTAAFSPGTTTTLAASVASTANTPGHSAPGSTQSPLASPWSAPLYVVLRTLPVKIRGMTGESVDVAVAWPGVASTEDIVDSHQCVLQPINSTRLCVVLGDNVDTPQIDTVTAANTEFKVNFQNEDRVVVRALLMQAFGDLGVAAKLDSTKDWTDSQANVSVQRVAVITPVEVTDSCLDFALTFQKRAPTSTSECVVVGKEMPQSVQRTFARELRKAVEVAIREKRSRHARGSKWRREARPSGNDVEVELSDLGPDNAPDRPPAQFPKDTADDAEFATAPEVSCFRVRSPGLITRLTSLQPQRLYRMRARPLLFSSSEGDSFGPWSASVAFRTAAQVKLQLDEVDEWSVAVRWARGNPLRWGGDRVKEVQEGNMREVTSTSFGSSADEYLAFVYRSVLRGAYEVLLETPMWADSVEQAAQASQFFSQSSSGALGDVVGPSVSVAEIFAPDVARAAFGGLTPDEPFVVKVRQISHPANELSSHYGTTALDTAGIEVETDHLSWCAKGLVVRTAPLLSTRVTLGREGAATVHIERLRPSSTVDEDAALISDRDGCDLVPATTSHRIAMHAVQLRIVEGAAPDDVTPVVEAGVERPRSPHLIDAPVPGTSPMRAAADPGAIPFPQLGFACEAGAYWEAAREGLLGPGATAAGMLPHELQFNQDDERLWWNAPPGEGTVPVHGTAAMLHEVLPTRDGSRLVNLAPAGVQGAFAVQLLGLGAGRHFAVQMRYSTGDVAAASPWHDWQRFATRAALQLRPVVIRELSVEVAWCATRHDDTEEPVIGFEVEICGLLLRDHRSRAVAHANNLASDGRGRLYSPLARTLLIEPEESHCTFAGLLSGRLYGIAVRAKLSAGTFGPTSRLLFVQTLPPLQAAPLAALERTILLKVSRSPLVAADMTALQAWCDLALGCQLEAMHALRDMDAAEAGLLLKDASVHTPAMPVERYDVAVQRRSEAGPHGAPAGDVVALPMGAAHFLLRNLEPDAEYSVSARSVSVAFPPCGALGSPAAERAAKADGASAVEESPDLLEERSNWSKPVPALTPPSAVLKVRHATSTKIAAALCLPRSTAQGRIVGTAAAPRLRQMIASGTYRVTIGDGTAMAFSMAALTGDDGGDPRDAATVVTLCAETGAETPLVIDGLRHSCRYHLAYAPVLPAEVIAAIPDLSVAEARAAGEGELLRTLCVVHTAPHQPPPPRLYEATPGHVSWMWDYDAVRADAFNLMVRRACESRGGVGNAHASAAVTRAYSGAADEAIDGVVSGILREGRCDIVVPAEAFPEAASVAGAFDGKLPQLSAGLSTLHAPYPLKGVFFVMECAAASTVPHENRRSPDPDDDADSVTGPRGELLHGAFVEVGRCTSPFYRVRVNPRDSCTALDVLRSSMVRVKAVVPLPQSSFTLESSWSPAVRGAALLPLGPPLHLSVDRVEGATAHLSWTWPHDVTAHNQVTMEVQLHREAFGEFETVLRVRYPATTATLDRLCLRESYKVRCRSASSFGAGELSMATRFATSGTLPKSTVGARGTGAAAAAAPRSIHELWGNGPGNSAATKSQGQAEESDPSYQISALEAQFPFAGFKDFDATPPPCDTPFHSESGRFAASLAAAAEGVLPVMARLGRARDDLPLVPGCALPVAPVRNPRPPRRAILAARSAARRNQSADKPKSRSGSATTRVAHEPAPPRAPRRGSV